MKCQEKLRNTAPFNVFTLFYPNKLLLQSKGVTQNPERWLKIGLLNDQRQSALRARNQLDSDPFST